MRQVLVSSWKLVLTSFKINDWEDARRFYAQSLFQSILRAQPHCSNEYFILPGGCLNTKSYHEGFSPQLSEPNSLLHVSVVSEVG